MLTRELHGCRIESVPAEYDESDGKVHCDGWTHTVYDTAGHSLGTAATFAEAISIARNRGAMKDDEP